MTVWSRGVVQNMVATALPSKSSFLISEVPSMYCTEDAVAAVKTDGSVVTWGHAGSAIALRSKSSSLMPTTSVTFLCCSLVTTVAGDEDIHCQVHTARANTQAATSA